MNAIRTGSARWMGTPDLTDLQEGTALLQITTSKGVQALYWCWTNGKGHSARLLKQDDEQAYSINLDRGTCSCPDHVQRGVTCKHVKALRAALPKIK